MFLDFMLRRFEENRGADAIIWKDQAYSFGWLLDRISRWRTYLGQQKIAPGSVVAVEADFSPSAVALLLALIENSCVLVPLTESVAKNKDSFKKIAQCSVSIRINPDDSCSLQALGREADHPLYAKLRGLAHPGLVLFSSGSTGRAKAALHDLCGILEKFRVPRQKLRALSFLLFDHIGGINTLLYQLSNAGCLVTVDDRSPEAVLAAVEKYKVELLPASPTFFNLILLSGAHQKYGLKDLKIMTYGTEPMQESVLKRFHAIYPHIKLQQTYGLSEVGILRSKSKSSDSLWVKIGGEGFETRVVKGILQIKAQSAMLGYLNEPSPFTEDGWFNTGDLVEVDGEYVRFLGRESEVINVGGEKVHPAEVESVIQEVAEVAETVVYGQSNPISGQMVCADVTLHGPAADAKALILKIKKYCAQKLQPYKVPVKIRIIEGALHSARYKKMRRSVAA